MHTHIKKWAFHMSHDSSCMQNDPYECHPILIRDDALQLGFIRDVSKIRLNNVHI